MVAIAYVARLRRPMIPMISPSFIDNSFAFLDERITVQSVVASFVAFKVFYRLMLKCFVNIK